MSAAEGTVEARMYPILPCPDVDEAIAFYEALGFTRTYRQVRPNPHAVVGLGEIQIHLAGIPGFDPSQSYASVIVVVADPDALYRNFAEGLRRKYGRLPVGIPRLTRPRKRYGTVYGFSLIDVGGNWIRVSRAGDVEEEAGNAEEGLARTIEVAARLADAKGDEATAFKTLESGLRRFPDALPLDRARGLIYLAELAVRLGKQQQASSLVAEAKDIDLSPADGALIAEEVAHVTELIGTG